jgi:predicted deacetylase
VSARYLLRLDDACHTMRRDSWSRVEAVLDAHHVQPIVAVIPDNRDPTLGFDPPEADFWQRVRSWASKGWTVGMHGYTHLMHGTQRAPMLPFYRRSEFAGLSLGEQADKIRASWQLFVANGIEPRVWVAPAHSFGALTLQALQRETPIRVISDGVAWDTYQEHGFHWIPQQLWSLAERPSGLWTVCLHPNTMDDASVTALDRALAKFRSRITCVREVVLHSRAKSTLGRVYHAYFWWQWRRSARAPVSVQADRE